MIFLKVYQYDIFSEYSGPEEHFQIKWGQPYLVGVILCPLIEIGLTYLPKISGDKSPMSPYVPTGLVFSRDNNNIEDSAAKPDPFF